MHRLILGCALLAASISCVQARDLDLVNKSKTAIHHLYLSSVNDREWGPDQLGNETVEPGETFTLTDIERGRFDVKLIAEDDTECVVEDVRFNDSKEWVVTERMLDRCDS